MIGRSEQITLGETLLVRENQTACTQGDFAALVTRQSQYVFRIAYALLRNSHDAEDVTQDVFLRVYRKRDWNKWNDERAYLARVAWRVAIDRRPKIHAQELLGRCVDCPSRMETPEEQALRGDWAGLVQQMIDSLPEELRLPLALSAADDQLKSSQIANILAIPEGTVRTRLMKARQVLKQKLSALMERNRGR